jgi:hypothetical protein
MRELWTLGNPKAMKGEAIGYLTAVLHLAPHNLADGKRSVCPYSTPECIRACLNTAGRGGIMRAGESTNPIQEARKRRTLEFFADRALFSRALLSDADRVNRKAMREGFKPAFRLNGTSDIDWKAIAPEFVAELGAIGTLYDYTKSKRKAARMADPIAYALSYTGELGDANACRTHLAAGGRVAVVFSTRKGSELPDTFLGAPVLDGDEHDLIFLRPAGCVLGLRAKGKARSAGADSKFVVQV